jgi:hypothetical protein
MISETVAAPLARIESDLKVMKETQTIRADIAHDAVTNRRDWLAPTLAAVLSALLTWMLALGAHRAGLL